MSTWYVIPTVSLIVFKISDLRRVLFQLVMLLESFIFSIRILAGMLTLA